MTSLVTERNPLTDKEQLVLKEIGKGLTSKEIAQTLYLSDGTIRNYTSTIIDKLQADNRFDAWKKRMTKDGYSTRLYFGTYLLCLHLS